MTTEDKFWLTVNCYHEARGEPEEGQIAVCHTVLNRATAKRKTVKEIVLQDKQFSWANGGARPPIKEYDAFIRCMVSAEKCLIEREQGQTYFDVDHYHTINVDPYWNENMIEVARIGKHIFYRS